MARTCDQFPPFPDERGVGAADQETYYTMVERLLGKGTSAFTLKTDSDLSIVLRLCNVAFDQWFAVDADDAARV